MRLVLMPPITRSDMPYPLRTLDSTVDIVVDDLLVTGNATFTGTVNIPGGIPAGPQPFYVAEDSTNQYRTNNSAMEFRATGPVTSYSFKNSNENTTNNTVIAGSFQGNGAFDGEKTSVQSNNDAGTLASAGYQGLAGTSTIDVLVGSVNNLPLGNRGLVRTADAAGLDLQASGASRNIRIKTGATTRVEVDDTNTDIKNNLKVTSGTASTTTTTGALTVAGGAGVLGDVYVGGNVKATSFSGAFGNTYNSDPNLTYSRLLGTGNGAPLAADATYLYTPGNSATAGNDYVLGVNKDGLQIPATVNSTTPTTGAIRTAGGVGVAQDLSVGGNINLTGSIITSGVTAFVPTFKNSGFGITYTSQVGEYYRIGKLVFVSIRLTTTSAIDNVVSNLVVQGLPLPLTTTLGSINSCALVEYGIGNAVDFVTAVITPANPTEIGFKGSRDNLGILDLESPTTAFNRELDVSLVYIS